MKVMLDTNILISAFVFKSEIMNKLIYKLSQKYEIIICSYTINELKEILKTKFNTKIKYFNEFLENFPFTLIYTPKNIKKDLFRIRDRDDYIILYTAIFYNIDIFITGDKDFDDVEVEKPKIMTVSQFLNKY